MFRYRNLKSVILILMVGLLGACCSRSAPPSVSEIHMQPAQPDYTIKVGEKASLGVDVTGGRLGFQWKAERGALSRHASSSTLYTAPDSPGLDAVSVTVADDCGVTERSITIQVLPPPAPAPPPTPETICIKVDVGSGPADITMRVGKETIWEGFALSGVVDVCVPYSYNGQSGQLKVSANGYISQTETVPINPGSTPYSFILTPAPTPTPTAVVIDDMDSLAGWGIFNDTLGSAVNISTTADGMVNNALQMDFDLKQGGFVGISKVITPAPLSETQGLRFFYMGTGPTDTIELKLLYKPDANGKGEVFSYSQREIAGAKDWVTFEQGYSAFGCGDTCRTPRQTLDPARVWKLEIAVSHQLGGAPGVGRVLVDQIEALKSFPCASCAGCVTGRGYGCSGNMATVEPGMSDQSCTDIFTLASPITTTQIRIEMAERALEAFGYSLYEVEAYGPEDSTKNLLIGGAVVASSVEDERYIASNAIDGGKITRWASAKQQDPQWLEITLPPPATPQPALIDRIVLKWEQAYATEYCVIVKPAQ